MILLVIVIVWYLIAVGASVSEYRRGETWLR